MAKKPETVFGEKVDSDLRKTFGKEVKIFNIQQVAKRGDPDRIICLKGDFLALELKIEGGRTETLQLLKLLEIRKAGGKAFLVYPYTWPAILEELKSFYCEL